MSEHVSSRSASVEREATLPGADEAKLTLKEAHTPASVVEEEAKSPERADETLRHASPNNEGVPVTPPNIQTEGHATIKRGSGLKIKLRCIQAALKEARSESLKSGPAKRKLSEYEEDDTDSEIELFPKRARAATNTVRLTFTKPEFNFKKSQLTFTKPKLNVKKPQLTFKKLQLQVSNAAKKAGKHYSSDESGEDTTSGDDDEVGSPSQKPVLKLSLVTPTMKRNERILNLNNPKHAKLIAGAAKIGPEYYDSDAEDLPGQVKDTNKPKLFRHVKWGAHATDFSNPADFAAEPEFSQFVPGRFEMLPNGEVADQKAKLIIKLTDKNGRLRIFKNPPPRDWNNQEAITALNKRSVQQIRRNTNVRFREVVRAYVPAERRWILANLVAGKPTKGWKQFVDDFNDKFCGATLRGTSGVRPYRSHSSLTKEVERFSAKYTKGQVPKAESA